MYVNYFIKWKINTQPTLERDIEAKNFEKWFPNK